MYRTIYILGVCISTSKISLVIECSAGSGSVKKVIWWCDMIPGVHSKNNFELIVYLGDIDQINQ